MQYTCIIIIPCPVKAVGYITHRLGERVVVATAFIAEAPNKDRWVVPVALYQVRHVLELGIRVLERVVVLAVVSIFVHRHKSKPIHEVETSLRRRVVRHTPGVAAHCAQGLHAEEVDAVVDS